MEMIGTPHITTANGTTIAWSEAGDVTARPLILLHGLGDSHRTWGRVAPLLAARYRVLMPDLPGHGLSGRPDATYTLDWYARTMAAWMDAIGVPRAHFAAHSFGGGVAQWMLLEERERFDHLALVAAGGLGREVGPALRLAAFPLLGAALTPAFMSAGTRAVMRTAYGAVAEKDEIERLVWMNNAPRSGAAFQKTVAACIDLFGQYKQTWDRVHEVASLPPIALFWGDRDRIVPVSHGHSASARMEGTSLTLYPGVGHFPHLESSETFAADLIRFFEDAGRPVASVPPPYLGSERKGARASMRRVLERVGERLRRILRGEETGAPRDLDAAA
jgi:pimeloyl-ACP methyl ester carboxylesterase